MLLVWVLVLGLAFDIHRTSEGASCSRKWEHTGVPLEDACIKPDAQKQIQYSSR